jgi:hypothetical protein
MMKNLLTIFSVLHCAFAATGQLASFQLERPEFKNIQLLEKKMLGKQFSYNFPITVSKDYFPGATTYRLANPLVYYRLNGKDRVEVSYFYSAPDKIVRLVEYSFDKAAADTLSLKQQFASNDSSFSAYFKSQATISSEMHATWWQQMNTWDNEKVHIRQFIVIGENTYRLRVLVSWKNKSASK